MPAYPRQAVLYLLCWQKLDFASPSQYIIALPLPRKLKRLTSMGKASKSQHAPLAQLDRASVYGTEGCGFDSLEARLILVGVVRRQAVAFVV